MMISRLALLAARRSPCLMVRNSHNGSHDIEKIPPYFRNITYDDIPPASGSWQARYDELNRKNSIFLAFSSVVFLITIYGLYSTHEWIGCPDEPAERWYPLDRFKDGDGKPVI